MFNKNLFQQLTAPGERLKNISELLLKDIWSQKKFNNNNLVDYLKNGEDAVNKLEDILSVCAPNFYNELIDNPEYDKSLELFLESNNRNSAAVILDGLSIREIPVILQLSQKANYRIIESGFSLSAAPTDTLYYIEKKLGCGFTAPSNLPSNKILKSKNIDFYYFSQVTERKNIIENSNSVILWSSFPDCCYSDNGSKTPELFNILIKQLETVFQNTIQVLPVNKKILITSDHGYVFFGAGSAFRSNIDTNELNNYFGNQRFLQFETQPVVEILNHPDVYINQKNKCAIIKGRVRSNSRGQSAVKLFKHGGISLMESIVPWIVIEKM